MYVRHNVMYVRHDVMYVLTKIDTSSETGVFKQLVQFRARPALGRIFIRVHFLALSEEQAESGPNRLQTCGDANPLFQSGEFCIRCRIECLCFSMDLFKEARCVVERDGS